MLTLKDLADSKSLDRDAMASIAGGSGYSFPGFPFKSVTKETLYDFSADVSVAQGNTQGLVNTINNANHTTPALKVLVVPRGASATHESQTAQMAISTPRKATKKKMPK